MARLFFQLLPLICLAAADTTSDRENQRRSPYYSNSSASTPTSTRQQHSTGTATQSRSTIATFITPTSTPSVHKASIDLDTSHTNDTLTTLQIDGHALPITCLNCTTTGQLDITSTSITWYDSPIQDLEDHKLGIKGGIINATLPSGLSGRIELSVPVLSGFSGVIPGPSFPLVGFALPDGIGKAGVTVKLSVPMSLKFETPMDLSFGFDWFVPPGSMLDIDIPHPENSSAKGFTAKEGLKMALLPVKVSSPGVDFEVKIALQMEVTVGLDLLDDDVVAEVGAALTFPFEEKVLQLNATQVDKSCNPLKQGQELPSPRLGGGSNNGTTTQSHPILGNYTNFRPSAGASLVVFAEDGLSFHMMGNESIGVQDRKAATLVGERWALPTQCVDNFPQAATTTSAKSAGTGKPSSTTSGTLATNTAHSGAEGLEMPSWKTSTVSLLVAVSWLVFAY